MAAFVSADLQAGGHWFESSTAHQPSHTGVHHLARMLIPFDVSYAHEVLTWAQDARELSAWAALDKRPDVSVFADWHADADVSAFLLLEAGKPIAYGEVWLERAERSVEFARILVSPVHRRRGVGSRLMGLLMELAQADSIEAFWLRVVCDNQPALRLYGSLGFAPVAEPEQRRLNADQRREYVWLRRPPGLEP